MPCSSGLTQLQGRMGSMERAAQSQAGAVTQGFPVPRVSCGFEYLPALSPLVWLGCSYLSHTGGLGDY